MDWFSKIVGGNVGELFQQIVGTFKLSPEKAAEMQQLAEQHKVELAQLDQQLELKAQDVLQAEVEAASANIRAEATNGDKFTSRARPSFIYVMLVILVCNYILFPLIHHVPLDFPEALFWLMGSCILGYTGARSWDKYLTANLGDKK